MSSFTATVPVPAAPHLRAVRSTPARRHPTGAPQPSQAPLTSIPEGAFVAALPQSALPQALLAQYGVQPEATDAASGLPMVGYLVLVPAEAAPAAPVPPTVPVPPGQGSGRGISVDVERRTAYVDGRLLDLTYLEFELLVHLTEHPQRVHTREHLISAVWGYGHVGDGRTVDVHVARLRRKLGMAYRGTIVTVRRVGYKYTPVASA
jgi:hypothetical protein